MPYDYQPFFNKFISEVLPLDQARVNRIDSAWRHLIEVVGGDTAFVRYRPKIVAQGSYAAGTSVRPVRTGDEFDVDLVVKVTLPASWTSDATLNWIRGRLALDSVFRPKLIRHPRCVRISYAGDFHLDVVPARRSGTYGLVRLKVPDRVGGWRFSNPEGFVRWCRLQDKRTGGDFTRVVMMLKRWRDNNAPEKRRIKSIVFTTLIGRSVPIWSGGGQSTRPDADILTATLAVMNRKLATFSGSPLVTNPSLVTENLARSWTRPDFLSFQSEVKTAWRTAILLRKSSDPHAWRALFGPSFPTTP